MTQFSDNIYSGFMAATSAADSRSAVVLRKVINFNNAAPAVGATFTGTFPPGVENIRGLLYITTPGSATVSDKITVSAGGTDLVTFTSFGSSQGVFDQTVVGLGTVVTNASALATPPVPASTNNGGEIPFSVTLLPSSASRSTQYRVVLTFNRRDGHFPA